MTLREAVAAGAVRLAADPLLAESAARDAELLLLHQLGLSRASRFAYPERRVSADEMAAYQAALDRRLLHEPIQYITGQQEFYGLAFHVTPAVLIPRPETELLVESVLELLPRDRSLRIVDVGTGSGAIAVVLAAHLPLARIMAVDTSPGALEVARRNAAAHGLLGRVEFVLSDLLKGVDCGPADCVVSNPPYVAESDRAEMHPQVREHEPCLALFAGADGLDVYRRLIPEAHAALVPGGLLALEIGYGQREALAGLLEGWRDVAFRDDLRGVPRVALAFTR